jgi:hypothetical protein
MAQVVQIKAPNIRSLTLRIIGTAPLVQAKCAMGRCTTPARGGWASLPAHFARR